MSRLRTSPGSDGRTHARGWDVVRLLAAALLLALLTPAPSCSRPKPPAGKNALVIRGRQQDIYFYPARGGDARAPKVIFLCGDGGWEGMAVEMAARMSSWGYDVYALDTKRYLESFTGETATLKEADIPGDFRQVASWATTRWNEKIILAGWSEGAGLALVAAASPEGKMSFSGLVTFGLSDSAELGWRWEDDETYVTGTDPEEPAFQTLPYMAKVAPPPLYMIQSTGDQFVSAETAGRLFDAAAQPKRFRTVEAENHAFRGNEEGFYQALSEGLQWVQQTGQ